MGKIAITDQDVICLKTDAFQALVQTMMRYIKEHHVVQEKWITAEEALKLLNLDSMTSLSALRNNGKIRFSNPTPRTFLYDKESILAHIESQSKTTF